MPPKIRRVPEGRWKILFFFFPPLGMGKEEQLEVIFLEQGVVCIEHGDSSVIRRGCLTGAFTPVFLAGSAFCCDAHDKSSATSGIWELVLVSLIRSPLRLTDLQDGLKKRRKSRDFQFGFWFLRSLF